MKKTVFFFIFIHFFLLGHQIRPENAWEKSKYFDTKFLKNYRLVKESLIQEEGFEEVNFFTPDKFKINGLLLRRPNATYNVVSTAGFYPGKKEGMATLFQLLPADCNILFLDARGHGKSSGNLWLTLHNYTKNEYNDIIGALDFVHNDNQMPILIHGVCAGAFHSARALVKLKKGGEFDSYNIKGIVLDSVFDSFYTSINAIDYHCNEKILPWTIKKLYKTDSKGEVKKRYLYRIARLALAGLIKPLKIPYTYRLKKLSHQTNLLDDIHLLTCPTFFIHAEDDKYVDINKIKKLAAKVQNATYWWITKPSEHACNHLIHKFEYRQHLLAFLDSILNT